MRRVLADIGPLVAILSRRDQYHRACVEALREMPGPLFTCWPVITEAAWLLRRDPTAVAQLLHSLDTGFLELLPLTTADAKPIAAILKKYRDIRIQLADAALVHLAARDGVDTIFTLDQRDFSVYRLPRGKAFRILPTRA
ncbi:MAG TPA: PIN domain-containing protein [Terriglobales bacterium]|jgi:predicted nucleic acid-binding protein|nr:PIN domain-containing protein [Terriglobales bacterium]